MTATGAGKNEEGEQQEQQQEEAKAKTAESDVAPKQWSPAIMGNRSPRFLPPPPPPPPARPCLLAVR